MFLIYTENVKTKQQMTSRANIEIQPTSGASLRGFKCSLTARSTGPLQWLAHRIAFRVMQLYDSCGLLQMHNSHALAHSHAVNSPSSLEDINDFLWTPSNNPSIVNPLFLIESLTPIAVLSLFLEKTSGWILESSCSFAFFLCVHRTVLSKYWKVPAQKVQDKNKAGISIVGSYLSTWSMIDTDTAKNTKPVIPAGVKLQLFAALFKVVITERPLTQEVSSLVTHLHFVMTRAGNAFFCSSSDEANAQSSKSTGRQIFHL